ncbi:hypothetical protein HY991_01635 [Candidatus Micrarchaeota archaeon]|nr:hypothetical protein [Candidatus Micrarchaeota archaeon]
MLPDATAKKLDYGHSQEGRDCPKKHERRNAFLLAMKQFCVSLEATHLGKASVKPKNRIIGRSQEGKKFIKVFSDNNSVLAITRVLKIPSSGFNSLSLELIRSPTPHSMYDRALDGFLSSPIMFIKVFGWIPISPIF